MISSLGRTVFNLKVKLRGPEGKTEKVNLPRLEFIPWGIQGTMVGRRPSPTGG